VCTHAKIVSRRLHITVLQVATSRDGTQGRKAFRPGFSISYFCKVVPWSPGKQQIFKKCFLTGLDFNAKKLLTVWAEAAGAGVGVGRWGGRGGGAAMGSVECQAGKGSVQVTEATSGI
jgi:hypothetical protein